MLVENIQRSKDFYTDVIGLEILHDWGNMVVFRERFAIHKATALLPEDETDKLTLPGKQGQNNLVVYFETDDIAETYRQTQEKGLEIIHGIVDLPWQKVFRMRDPDGHILEIGNPF